MEKQRKHTLYYVQRSLLNGYTEETIHHPMYDWESTQIHDGDNYKYFDTKEEAQNFIDEEDKVTAEGAEWTYNIIAHRDGTGGLYRMKDMIYDIKILKPVAEQVEDIIINYVIEGTIAEPFTVNDIDVFMTENEIVISRENEVILQIDL